MNYPTLKWGPTNGRWGCAEAVEYAVYKLGALTTRCQALGVTERANA